MKVHPLEQFYKENVNRLKEQMKKQEKERLDRLRQQIRRCIREEQKAYYEQKLREEKAARERELRLVQDELTRITEQAVRLREQIGQALGEKEG